MHLDNIYLLKKEFYNYICIFKQLLCLFDNLKSICFLNNKFFFRFLFKLILKVLCCEIVSIVCFIALSKCIIIKILIDSMFLNFISNIFFYIFTIRLKDLHSNSRFTQFLNSNRDSLAIIALFLIQFLFIIDLFLCAIAICNTF